MVTVTGAEKRALDKNIDLDTIVTMIQLLQSYKDTIYDE